MTKALGYGLTVFTVAAGLAIAGGDISREDVVALKYGDIVYVRSWFSPTQDVVTKIGRKGANQQINFLSAFLVSSDSPMTQEGFEDGILFHSSADDAAPWNLNGSCIGGNHGASDVLIITSPVHRLTVADIGSTWRDEAGITFYVLDVPEPDEFLVLSENKATAPFWSFVRSIKGDKLVGVDKERTLPVTAVALTELRPSCRINSRACLLDGVVSFPDRIPVLCGYLDIVEDYDIISPIAVLESLKTNPGRKVDVVAKDLDAVVNNRIVYRFLPEGTCVVRHHSTALRDFNLGYMGFIQSAKLQKDRFDTHEYYIPKTLPFKVDEHPFNFRDLQDFSTPLERPCVFSLANGNIKDPANLPDRYIQFLGMKENGKIRRKIGYALGYSTMKGVTRSKLRSQNVDTPVWIDTSGKTCPQAIDAKIRTMIKTGTIFDCTAYRQYFDPSANPNATCVYGNDQRDSYVLYADYHQAWRRMSSNYPQVSSASALRLLKKLPRSPFSPATPSRPRG